MTLRINKDIRKIIARVLMAVILILVAIFFIRVAIFENNYYMEKEGSERAITTEEIDDGRNLVEVAPTETEVKEWVVAADRPRYLSVERLNIVNARVLPVGVDENNSLDTPNNIFDAGWYVESGKPGSGGTLLIDGHNGGPHVRGIFKELPSLTIGDVVVVERGDGVKFRYTVVDSVEIPLSESDEYMFTAMKSPETGVESLTIISCTGEWSSAENTYLSRQFVRAVLTDES